jgi:hypothetical protein
MIIIDESVGGRLFNRLKAHVNDIISIQQNYSSVNDRRVIEIAKDNNVGLTQIGYLATSIAE